MRSSLFSGSITRRKVCHGAQYVICVGICQHNTLLTRNTSRPTRRATVWKSAPSSKATQMDGRTEKEETDLSVFEAHELTPRCTSPAKKQYQLRPEKVFKQSERYGQKNEKRSRDLCRRAARAQAQEPPLCSF